MCLMHDNPGRSHVNSSEATPRRRKNLPVASNFAASSRSTATRCRRRLAIHEASPGRVTCVTSSDYRRPARDTSDKEKPGTSDTHLSSESRRVEISPGAFSTRNPSATRRRNLTLTLGVLRPAPAATLQAAPAAILGRTPGVARSRRTLDRSSCALRRTRASPRPG